VRYNLSSNIADLGYPAPSDDGSWPGVWSDGVDAALLLSSTAAAPTLGHTLIGPVLAADRQNVTGMVPRDTTGTVPVGTRSVQIELQMTRQSGLINDAAADNLELVLNPNGP